jgi:hypothetical protein
MAASSNTLLNSYDFLSSDDEDEESDYGPFWPKNL